MDMDTARKAAPVSKVSDVIQTFRPSKLIKATASYTSIDYDASGEFLLLARTDDTIQLFNMNAGQHAKECKSQKYGNALARFTHNSSNIIYASTKLDDGIRYLCMHDNSFIRYFRGHEDRVTSLCVSPSNDHFLSASLDNTVKLWDLRSSHAQGELRLEAPWLTAYDPSATVIAVASTLAQVICLYDLKNYDKPPFAQFDMLEIEKKVGATHGQPQAKGWTGLEFSNNGKYLLLSTNGPGHYVLDAFSGDLIHYLQRPGGATSHRAPGDTTSSVPYTQADASFSPDGRYVIGGNGSQNGLLVWDVNEEPKRDHVLSPMTDLQSSKPASVVAYNPRHNQISTADKEVMLWLPDPE